MMQPSSLGYCIFEVSSLDKWQRFASHVVGLHADRVRSDGMLALRMDERAHRILLMEGPADDIVAAGWEFPTELALENYVDLLRSRDVEIFPGEAALLHSRRVCKLYRCTDPNGWQHEFYYGPAVERSDEPLQMPLIKSGFTTGRLGVGHIVSVAKNAALTNDFYQGVLNFSVTDYISAASELTSGAVLDITFYHVAAGRHHSIAVSEILGYPKCMNHIMLETNAMTDVGLAYDRFIAADIPIISTIGQHPNDGMVSFYAMTPSGFAIEIGFGGVVVDDRDWEIKRYAETSIWGHKAVPAPR